jgi:hypothetical protein
MILADIHGPSARKSSLKNYFSVRIEDDVYIGSSGAQIARFGSGMTCESSERLTRAL